VINFSDIRDSVYVCSVSPIDPQFLKEWSETMQNHDIPLDLEEWKFITESEIMILTAAVDEARKKGH
jgi:hypothetical protein